MVRTLRPAPPAPVDGAVPSFPRRFVRGTAFWLFGLAASVLIATLWGSTLAGNRASVDRIVDRVAESRIVQERLVGWAVEGLDSVLLRLPAEDALLGLPSIREVLAALVDQAVDAAFAPIDAPVAIDPAAALAPAVPEITDLLRSEGMAVDEASVAAAVSAIEPIPLDLDSDLPLASAATRTSRTLTLAAVASALAMLIFGAIAVAMSPDRIAAVRHLGFRLTLSGLSFAVLLVLGSWLADPRWGASPWRAGVARLLGSHVGVPLIVAAVGAAVVGAVTWRLRRSGEVA